MIIMSKQTRKTFTISIITILLILSVGLFSNTTAESKEKAKKVLFISSYSESFPNVPDEIEGIKSVFESNNITLDIEYMDTKRFDSVEHQKIFYQILKYKLSTLITYDAVLVGDDSALQFALDYQEEMFEGIPIVFLAVNDYNRVLEAKERENITGVVEALSIKENIETAFKLNKKAKKVVAIVDDTITGIADKDQFYSVKEALPELEFTHINASEYTSIELVNLFEEIKSDTIVLYLSMNTNKIQKLISIDEASTILSEHVNVPIYRAEVGGLGLGILGGKMVSYVETGKMAADMIVSILNGSDVNSIQINYNSPNYYVFDYDIISKYDLNEDLIPKEATFINKEPSFYEQYKQTIWIIAVIMAFMFVLAVVLIIDNIKRRIIEKQLKENNEVLTQTYEELTASEEELRAQYETIEDHMNMIELLNQKYQVAIEGTDSAVWELNIQNKKITVSKNFNSIVKRPIQDKEDVMEFLDQFLLAEDKERVLQEYYAYKQGIKSEINIEVPIVDQDQSIKWLLIRGKGMVNTSGCFRLIHGISLDITQRKNQENHINHLANHDYLTNLPNRMAFTNKLKQELDNNHGGAIFLMDIDNFKGVNDTLGHIYGDEILIEISKRLRSVDSDRLFVSRFGGDEFLILVLNQENKEELELIVHMIKHVVERCMVIKNKENYIKFSMGISRFSKDGREVDQLLMKADTAMYQAKSDGRNNYLFYHEGMEDALRDQLQMEEILKKAIETDGLYLVYQPQVSTISGEIMGFEALLRIKENEIPIYKFISIAEQTGLIIEIGRWVTREAVRQIARWNKKGFKMIPIAINYSNKQLGDQGYLNFLKDTLQENGVPAECLEIEITESIFLEKSNKTIEFLENLKGIGVKLALDDFGTGYSSLNYLTFIPVNKIKLDKSLIDKFLGEEDFQVVDCIISLAHSLKLEITAEGVEEFIQFDLLKKGGCDNIQGYLFSKPLIIEELEKIYNFNLIQERMKE